MEWSELFTSAALISLVSLTFMEVILGIDNIVFITIVAGKLHKNQQARAINLGLILALVFRVALLFAITWIIGMTEPVFSITWIPFVDSFAPTWRELILLAGGLFLLYKSVSEMHQKLEGKQEELPQASTDQFNSILGQIVLLNVVFSFDSILTAVGLVPTGAGANMQVALAIMVIAVILSMIIMMLTASRIGAFIEQHPTMKMLALAFLLLIGFMLTFEGLHSAHHNEVPKGYVYFAMAFSFGVELLNLRLRKTSREPVELRKRLVEEQEQ